MNSLLSNLGPRYSRRNGTTPIILGFLLLIIAIAVVTYFITRDDDDEDKNKPEKTPDLPTVSNVGVKRTLNPDSRGSESGTSETYEIGGGKTETYQIEYNTGEQFSDEEKKLLSRNVDLTVSWDNGIGFDNVTEIIFRRKIDGTVKRKITYIKSGSTGEILKYFQSNQKGLSLKFDNIDDDGNMYSVVGKNTISISVKLPGKDDETELFPGTSTAGVSVVIGLGDLSSTLEITSSRSQMYYPVTSAFNINNLEISKDIYSIKPSLTYPSPFSQMLKMECGNDKLNDKDNDFHFIIPDTSKPGKFKLQVATDDEDDKWVKVCDSNQLAITSGSSGASIFELITSDKEAESGSSYNKFMISGQTDDEDDLFMYVKDSDSKPKLYMGTVDTMDADEYKSMDMLIGSSGDQCGSGANKYKFYLWKKWSNGYGYLSATSGFYMDFKVKPFPTKDDETEPARITIKQDPDNDNNVLMYSANGQVDGNDDKLRVFSNNNTKSPVAKTYFFDSNGNIKDDHNIYCHNHKEIRTLTEFNKHIEP